MVLSRLLFLRSGLTPKVPERSEAFTTSKRSASKQISTLLIKDVGSVSRFKGIVHPKKKTCWKFISRWGKHYYGLLTQWILVINVLMLDLFHLLSSPDVNWSAVDYCDVFIRLSFWRHPFTAEHPLLRHWCSDAFIQTWWRNKLIWSQMNWAWVHFHF